MRLIVHRRQVLKIKVRVDLSRAYIAVPEQFLNGAQITTGLQQMAGERVSEHMRVDADVSTGSLGKRFHPVLNLPGADAPPRF